MNDNWVGRRTPLSLVSPAVFLAAVAAALGLWLARAGGAEALLASAALALTVLLGIAWQRRARAARRWNAAVDAYADREIARARRLAAPRRAAAGAAGSSTRRVS